MILDEVHAVAGTKRGAHLALSLERLDELLERPAQRIGLSATVRPLDEVSTFLAGARPVEVVQPRTPKTVEVSVEVPVPDLAALDERPAPGSSDEEVVGSAAGTAQRPSIWPAVERRLLELVRAHRSHDRVRQLPPARRAAHVAAQRAGRRRGRGRPGSRRRVPRRGDRAVRHRRRRSLPRWRRPTTARCRASSARSSRRS